MELFQWPQWGISFYRNGSITELGGFTQRWGDKHLVHTMPKTINQKFSVEKKLNYSQLKHLDMGIFPAAYAIDLCQLQLTETSLSLIIFT